MKCLGCGNEISWDGKGAFAYTCSCGATMLYDENKGFIPPASFVIALYTKKELPHIDYYLGKSDHWSKEKQRLYDFLRSRGAIWSWECEQCKERVLRRTKMEKKEGLYPKTFHKELERLITQSVVGR